MSCRYYLFPRQIIYLFFLLWAYCNVIDSCCREIIRLRGKYRTTSEAINKSTIIAIILLILRSFQRKGLCDSGLKAKSTTFVRNITTIRLRSQFVILKMDINMTDKIGKRRAANCVYHIGASIKDLGKKWFVSPRWRYLHQTNWWKESIESNL